MYITQMPHSPVLWRRSAPSPCRRRCTWRAGVRPRRAWRVWRCRTWSGSPLPPCTLSASLRSAPRLSGASWSPGRSSVCLPSSSRPALAPLEPEVLYELLARAGVDAPLLGELRLQALRPLRSLLRHLVELVHVDSHAPTLHGVQGVGDTQLELVDPLQAGPLYLAHERLCQPRQYRGVPGGVLYLLAREGRRPQSDTCSSLASSRLSSRLTTAARLW